MELVSLLLVLTGSITLFFVLLVVSTLLNGWALHLLWQWFVIPIFPVPTISIGQAIGFAMVVSFLTYQYIDAQPKDEKSSIKLFGLFCLTVLRPLLSVAFGWLIYRFLL